MVQCWSAGGMPPPPRVKKHFPQKSIFLLQMSKKRVFRVKNRFFSKNQLLRNPPWGGGHGRGQKNIFLKNSIFLLQMPKKVFSRGLCKYKYNLHFGRLYCLSRREESWEKKLSRREESWGKKLSACLLACLSAGSKEHFL